MWAYISNDNAYGISIGYLIKSKADISGIRGLISLSLGNFFDDHYKLVALNVGVLKLFYAKNNFPFSIGASASEIIFNHTFKVVPSVMYNQSFFAKNSVYPVVGVSMDFQDYQRSMLDNLYFHVGLNIRLSNPDVENK